MNIARTAAALLMLAALGTAALTPSERTREQVKAGLAEVVRNDDVLGASEYGGKSREWLGHDQSA